MNTYQIEKIEKAPHGEAVAIARNGINSFSFGVPLNADERRQLDALCQQIEQRVAAEIAAQRGEQEQLAKG